MHRNDVAEQDRREALELVAKAETELKHLLKKWGKKDDEEIYAKIAEVHELLDKAKRRLEPLGWAV